MVWGKFAESQEEEAAEGLSASPRQGSEPSPLTQLGTCSNKDGRRSASPLFLNLPNPPGP